MRTALLLGCISFYSWGLLQTHAKLHAYLLSWPIPFSILQPNFFKKHNLVITCVCNESLIPCYFTTDGIKPLCLTWKGSYIKFQSVFSHFHSLPYVQPTRFLAFYWPPYNCLKCRLFCLSLKTWFQTGATLKSCSHLFSYSLKIVEQIK